MIKRSSDRLTLSPSRKDGNFRTSIFKNESTCADAVICFFSLNGIWYHRTWLSTQFRFVYFIEWSLAPPQLTLDPMNHRKANPSFTMSRILSYFSTDFPPEFHIFLGAISSHTWSHHSEKCMVYWFSFSFQDKNNIDPHSIWSINITFA